MRGLVFSFLVVAMGFLGVRGGCAEEPAATPAAHQKVVVIPVREQIAKPELYILRRGLKAAIEDGVETIVLDMDTPGGALNVTFDILKALEKFPGKTVTYVNREAISAGALIAAGTDEIYFAPGGVIGAAAPVMITGGEMDEATRGKIVSYLKARVRSMSEGKGYRGQVISAMIDMDSELRIGDTVIKEKGELLSLTAQEAVKLYGDPPQPLLALGIEENLDALLDRLYGAGNYSVLQLQVTWSERLAQYLTGLTPILLGLGMSLLLIEFKTPGFGVFGVTGIVLLAIVFMAQYVAGLSGHEPLLFFMIGLLLVAGELLFFPGLIVPSVIGAVLMVVSLVWSMADLWPSEPLEFVGDVFVRPLLNVISGMVLGVILFAIIFRFLPKGSLFGGLVLEAAVAGEPVAARALTDGGLVGNALIGATGVAATDLFPSGQVEIDGRRYEARLEGGFSMAGTAVRVTGVSDFGLIVEGVS